MAASHFSGPVYSANGFVGTVNNQIAVSALATSGSGTQSDPWVGWDTKINWATSSYKQYNLCDGYFSYSSTLVWPQGLNNFGFITSAGTVLVYTGSGLAIDAGGTGAVLVNQNWEIKIAKLQGTTSASGGCRFYQITRSNVDITFAGFSDSAILMLEGTSVMVKYTLKGYGGYSLLKSVYLGTAGGPPDPGNSSANEYYIIAEGQSNRGIWLSGVVNSQFYIRTSEAIAYPSGSGVGLWIEPANYGSVNSNNFYMYDFEAISNLDLKLVNGIYNNFFGGDISSNNGSSIGGGFNSFYGTTFGAVTNTGSCNAYYSAKWKSFTETGVLSTKISCWNWVTQTLEPNLLQKGLNINGNIKQGATYYGNANGATPVQVVDLATVMTDNYSAGRIKIFSAENNRVNTSYCEYIVNRAVSLGGAAVYALSDRQNQLNVTSGGTAGNSSVVATLIGSNLKIASDSSPAYNPAFAVTFELIAG